MKFDQPLSAKEIADFIGAKVIGDPNVVASGINEVHHAQPGDIVFSDLDKYFAKALNSPGTVVILNKPWECPEGKAILLCDNPFEAFNSIVLKYRPINRLNSAISPEAEIHPTAIIEPNVTIGPYVNIGKNSHIQSNVTIAEHCIIGEEVTIQSGAVIGAEAFYFKRYPDGAYTKWRSAGRVIIEDRADIGPKCTITKGVSSDTVIGEGSKLDAHVHIGHDTKVGKNCLFAAQVGVAGNVTIGNRVILYGQVGIIQNITIGDGVIVLAQSGIGKSLEAGKVYLGSPAKEARLMYREIAAAGQLPEFLVDYRKKHKE